MEVQKREFSLHRKQRHAEGNDWETNDRRKKTDVENLRGAGREKPYRFL